MWNDAAAILFVACALALAYMIVNSKGKGKK